MIQLSDIHTPEQLADALARCGFASHAPDLSNAAGAVKKLPPAAPVRGLSGDPYQGFYVAVVDGALQVHSWIMLMCVLRGAVPEALLAEKIELCAAPARPPSDPELCICLDLPLPFHHYEKARFIGIDETSGRFGEVTLRRCLHCGRHWLHYFVEYEAYRASGRYFMGLITPQAAESLTPAGAVDYLASLDWHLYGGSYFDGKTGKSQGKRIDVDG